MSTIHYQGRTLSLLAGETVLNAMLRAGIVTPFSCKGGSCHTCMLQCTQGTLPEKSQRGLAERLREKGYFLPCQCVPDGALHVAPAQPEDRMASALFVESRLEGNELHIVFEVAGVFRFYDGQIVRLVTGATPEPRWRLTGRASSVIEARWVLAQGETPPAWLQPGAEYGHEFMLRGPLNPDYGDIPEKQPLPPAPALWAELGGGPRVRAALEKFYARVYADPVLLPFFNRVTIERAIGKQYSFMEQSLTGNRVYWGEDMRNAHHWMVISQEIFNHRQRVMKETLREEGFSEDQIRRWTHFEEHFRSDMVKDREWPKRDGDRLLNLEGFDHVELSAGTMCDSCGAEVHPGSVVSCHRRTGRISCPQCMPAA